ncbi:MAG: transketolase [Chloroflexi bacterium]|nr:transketolase [Chloroflexota bacterium]
MDSYQLTVNTIRTLSMDAIQKANSGHPGLPMGMADAATVLWSQFLKFDPQDPEWPDRDRFVLSAGHGSMLLYALLHLSGYDLTLDDIKQFRQWGSRTPGHPEYGHTPGVEMTTGPLGQGISAAVGMALAERWQAARFNRPGYEVMNHHTFVIAGDGDLMEGVSSEACSLAGHWQLGRLIVLYDDNHISIDGSTGIAFTEDALQRYEAYGWHTLRIDGHDREAVAAAIQEALDETSRPSLIACRTTIGYGSPNRAGTAKAHGEPLGEEEIHLTKENLGWPYKEPFTVPEGADQPLKTAAKKGQAAHAQWRELMAEYEKAHPDLAAELRRAFRGELPPNWDATMPEFDGKPLATRAASGQTLNAIISNNPDMLGGSADLTGSNKTITSGAKDIQAGQYDGRYIRYGVREHGMGAIMNGLSLHGVIPYGGTFLVFSDYMRGAIRLAALMNQGVIYVFTHDSIGLGEDGPTHQPIEHLAALRAMPNLTVIRPADAWETAVAWKVALQNRATPTALALTRQKLPELDRVKAEGLTNGAYVVSDAPDFQAILIASGSEVSIALDAQKILAEQGVAARVVSMPSWELFEAMPQSYQDEVLPPAITARVSMEAGVTQGWERYTGSSGITLGINHFGASAPYETIYREFGLTPEAMADAAQSLL